MHSSPKNYSPILFLRFLPLFFLIISSFSVHSLLGPHYSAAGTNEVDSTITLHLGFVGDLMCHQPIYESARVKPDSFDFAPMFSYVLDHLSAPDVMIGNLETVCAGKERTYSGYPRFNTPDSYIDALKNSSFDFLVTGNNHSMDRGEFGVLKTLEKLRSLGISSAGTYSGKPDRDSVRIIETNGIKSAILNYTYGTNGILLPRGKSYLVNIIDTALIRRDIDSAIRKAPDLLVVVFHFGTEYKREPDDYQKRIVDFTIRAGADIIIGSHPHVIQRMERFVTNNGRIDTGFVAYSLGNFLSNQRWRYSDAGVILNIKLEKNRFTDRIKISEIHPVPVWVYTGHYEGKRRYYILPATDSPDTLNYPFLSAPDRQNIKQAYEDTYQILYSGFR